MTAPVGCPECGDLRGSVRHTGRDLLGRRIRDRVCLTCHTNYPTLEITVPDTTFHRLNDMPWRPRKHQKTDIRYPLRRPSVVAIRMAVRNYPRDFTPRHT